MPTLTTLNPGPVSPQEDEPFQHADYCAVLEDGVCESASCATDMRSVGEVGFWAARRAGGPRVLILPATGVGSELSLDDAERLGRELIEFAQGLR